MVANKKMVQRNLLDRKQSQEVRSRLAQLLEQEQEVVQEEFDPFERWEDAE
jgi:hypothetical protein